MAAARLSLLLVAVYTVPGAAFFYGFPSGKGSGPGPLARRVSYLSTRSRLALQAVQTLQVLYALELGLLTPRHRAPVFARSMRLAPLATLSTPPSAARLRSQSGL